MSNILRVWAGLFAVIGLGLYALATAVKYEFIEVSGMDPTVVGFSSLFSMGMAIVMMGSRLVGFVAIGLAFVGVASSGVMG